MALPSCPGSQAGRGSLLQLSGAMSVDADTGHVSCTLVPPQTDNSTRTATTSFVVAQQGNRMPTQFVGTSTTADGQVGQYGQSVELTAPVELTIPHPQVPPPALGLGYTPTLDIWNSASQPSTLVAQGCIFRGPKGSQAPTLTLPPDACVYMEHNGTDWIVKR